MVGDGTRIVHILPTSMAFEPQIQLGGGASFDATVDFFHFRSCPRFGRFNCFLVGLGSAVGPSWWLRYRIIPPRPILAAPIDLPHWMAMACCCIRSMRSFRSAAVASSYESIVLSRIHSLISVHIDHSFQFRRFSQFLISFLQRQDGFLFGLCENIRHIQIH